MWAVKPLEGKFVAEVPDDLNTASCLNEIKATPILFVHNGAVPLAPYDAARLLFDSYQGPKEFLETRQLDSSRSAHGFRIRHDGASENSRVCKTESPVDLGSNVRPGAPTAEGLTIVIIK